MKRWLLGGLRARRRAVRSQAQLRLTLDEALEIALSENPTIRIAELEVERYELCQTPDVGRVAAPGVGQRQLHTLDRQAGGGQGDLVRCGQHAQHHGRRGIAAVWHRPFTARSK